MRLKIVAHSFVPSSSSRGVVPLLSSHCQ
jgi:hypothetical protein